MDKDTKILNAIMKRYKGLTMLSSAVQDDADTAIENLLSDIGDKKVTYGDVEDYIHRVLG